MDLESRTKHRCRLAYRSFCVYVVAGVGNYCTRKWIAQKNSEVFLRGENKILSKFTARLYLLQMNETK